ncbi:MAG: TolC family protein, partial [Burkholderiaceae bacterium]|nr:TolC family protein [Burkholderiaceae bacterium]
MNSHLFALLLGCSLATPSFALTYAEALALAEQSSPALRAQQAALAGAVSAQGAASALPDPRLSVGVENLPISGADRFSLSRDFMTMQRIGLMQEVPNRAKRDARSQGAQARAERERALLALGVLQLRQALDRSWASAHFALRRQAALAEIVLENQ